MDAAPSGSLSLRCEQAELVGQTALICVQKPKSYEPYLIGTPAVVVAALGFGVVHILSVRRQRRDEQFKMVQATRDMIAAISTDAETAWLQTKDRASRGPVLIQRVGRVGRAVQQLRVRHKDLNVDTEVTAFRQAVTMDFEDGKASVDRAAEIAITAAELDEGIILQFLKRYG